MLDKYLTVKQLCEVLNMSKSGIYQLVRRGELPRGIWIGGAHRWSATSIQTFLHSKEQEAMTQC